MYAHTHTHPHTRTSTHLLVGASLAVEGVLELAVLIHHFQGLVPFEVVRVCVLCVCFVCASCVLRVWGLL